MQFNLTYLEAVDALEQGKVVGREAWIKHKYNLNQQSYFLVPRPNDRVPSEMVNKIKTIPDTLKSYISKYCEGMDLNFINSVAIFCPATCTLETNGWYATEEDYSANDWGVIE